MKKSFTNELISESSPYLLQHAHNPVNWIPWSDDVFEIAQRENKMVLVSVGYSACHWCHVMEHECFEDAEVAELMNRHFINVKVDREERPDVDQVYMTAVQIMTQKGGWPLNCFTLPDGRPVYGGTYFPKNQWMHVLKSLQYVFENDLPKMQETAKNITDGVNQSELIRQPEKDVQFQDEKLTELIQRWARSFDLNYGGPTRAPKFMLPNNLNFLLEYGLASKSEKVLNYVELTLDKMVLGGIYDQIKGGFSRYSVDMLWKVPHFEKMLYDNAQLIETYALGYKIFKKPLYKRMIQQTIDWLNDEMLDNDGGYFSAIDADSEGVEGKFYVWKESELREVLADDYVTASQIYAFNERGFWEHGNTILLRTDDDSSVLKKTGWSQQELEKNIEKVNDRLTEHRKGRIRPGLDNKKITSWNAMLLKGLCVANTVLKDVRIEKMMVDLSTWLETRIENTTILRIKSHRQKIDGFLEDYAHVLDAMLEMYRYQFDRKWLDRGLELLKIIDTTFLDKNSQMYFFTENTSTLIARKMDINDNVIPAGNSVMAHNLYRLGHYFKNQDLINRSHQMLANVYDGMENYGSGYSNWAILLHRILHGSIEVSCSTKAQAIEILNSSTGITDIVTVIDADNNLPMNQDKTAENDAIYVCEEGTCYAPVKTVEEAFAYL